MESPRKRLKTEEEVPSNQAAKMALQELGDDEAMVLEPVRKDSAHSMQWREPLLDKELHERRGMSREHQKLHHLGHLGNLDDLPLSAVIANPEPRQATDDDASTPTATTTVVKVSSVFVPPSVPAFPSTLTPPSVPSVPSTTPTASGSGSGSASGGSNSKSKHSKTSTRHSSSRTQKSSTKGSSSTRSKSTSPKQTSHKETSGPSTTRKPSTVADDSKPSSTPTRPASPPSAVEPSTSSAALTTPLSTTRSPATPESLQQSIPGTSPTTPSIQVPTSTPGIPVTPASATPPVTPSTTSFPTSLPTPPTTTPEEVYPTSSSISIPGLPTTSNTDPNAPLTPTTPAIPSAPTTDPSDPGATVDWTKSIPLSTPVPFSSSIPIPFTSTPVASSPTFGTFSSPKASSTSKSTSKTSGKNSPATSSPTSRSKSPSKSPTGSPDTTTKRRPSTFITATSAGHHPKQSPSLHETVTGHGQSTTAGGAGAGAITGAHDSAHGAKNGDDDGGNGGPAPTPQIVGGVVGGLAGLALILVIVLFLLRRYKQKHRGLHQLGDSEPGAGPQSGGPGMTERSGLLPAATGLMSRALGNNAAGAGAGASASDQPRGFERVSGRKLPSAFSGGMEAGRLPPTGTYGATGAAGAAGAAGTAGNAGTSENAPALAMPFGTSPTDSEEGGEGTLSALSFYRDSRGFYGGDGEQENPFRDPSPIPSPSPVAGIRPESQNLIQGPQRSPMVHHQSGGPFSSMMAGGENGLTPPQTPYIDDTRQSAGSGTGSLGRSHPSFEGSRGSRFTEDFF